jgi:hypothetical protein
MSIDKAKVLPLFVFFSGVSYTLYPYIDLQVVPARKVEVPEKLNPAWFRAQLPPVSSRNPFQSAISAAMAEKAPKDFAASKTGAKPASSINGEPKKNPDPPPDLSGFKLGAVVLGGPRPAAVINGRVYRVGDVLQSPSDKSPRSLQVIRIRDDGVDLREGRRMVAATLNFVRPADPAQKGASQIATAVRQPSAPSQRTIEMEQLREILGPASDSLTPIPPGVTETLGRMLGADLRNGDFGALESLLGSSSPGPAGMGPLQGGR